MSEAPPHLDAKTFPVIFAAPSGAGKTSIARALAKRRSDVAFSISATTRQPRSYERDGVDYLFMDEPTFERMVADGDLLEWARVHGNLYGTPRRNLEEAQARGSYLILDIDVEGSRQIRRAVPEAVSIFVLPPSGTELLQRLLGRGSEEVEVRRRRLRAARKEIAAAAEFDYVIVNEDVEKAVDVVEGIIAAEQHRVQRAAALAAEVERLCREVDHCLAEGADSPGS